MLKDLSLLFVFASLEIVSCQKPPRIPYVYLPGQKFSLPPICSNIAEWRDIAKSLEILSDMTEPKREKSAFTSLMNLIKFVLVKEELSCPVIQQMTRCGGKITNAVTTLQNSQIVSKIEAALAKKPAKAEQVEVNDYIDIRNMIPVLKSRGKARKKGVNAAPIPAEAGDTNSTSPESKVAQDASVTSVGTSTPAANLESKVCQYSKCRPLSLNLALQPPRSNLPCQRLQIVNLSPVVMGCSRNCNCQLSPVATKCRRLSPIVLTGCQKLTNPTLRENQAILSSMRNETLPLMNCYGNMLNKVTTRILVPYCLAKLA